MIEVGIQALPITDVAKDWLKSQIEYRVALHSRSGCAVSKDDAYQDFLSKARVWPQGQRANELYGAFKAGYAAGVKEIDWDQCQWMIGSAVSDVLRDVGSALTIAPSDVIVGPPEG